MVSSRSPRFLRSRTHHMGDRKRKMKEDYSSQFDPEWNEGAEITARLRANAQGGKKWDQGKPRPSLLPVKGLEAVLPVLEHGAAKYGDRNWTLVEKERYVEALGRHFLQWLHGVQAGDILVTDDDSGLSHLSHLAVNALFLLELAEGDAHE